MRAVSANFRRTALALAAALVAVPVAGARGSGSPGAAAIVKALKSGGSFSGMGLDIPGVLDLTSVPVVRGNFRCADCRLGGLDASNVTFKGTVDLGGADVQGPVDFRGAVFQRPALFGKEFAPSGQGTEFQTVADFSLATFEDLVSFRGAAFDAVARFEIARFRGDSDFSGATFDDVADFSRAEFSGVAGFRVSEFMHEAIFDGADFQQSADFRLASFDQKGTFDTARFAGGASFVAAEFSGEDSEQAASFERASSQKTLDFEDATFSVTSDFRNLSATAISFDHAEFGPRTVLYMGDVSSEDLELSVDDVGHVGSGARKRVLRLIESSAKNRDDIAVANDADYELHVLASRRHSWPRRVADLLVYRGVVGYFVRPLRPLAAALALALALALWREFRPARLRWPRRLARAGPVVTAAARPVGRLLTQTFDSLASFGRGKPDPAKPRALGQRLEGLAYRLLVVCALIGLANSNPTLRQMFDALL
jgi:uncharacterized protein YjbI with pentapeptide repeats